MHRVKLSIGLAWWLLLAYAGPAHSITIDVIPDFQEVDVGTSVSVDVTISGLGDTTAPSLSSFDLNINYDPARLFFVGVGGASFGDQLDLFGLGSMRLVDDSVPGIVNLFELSFDLPDDLNNLQLPSFTLATLTFDTIGAGTSALTVAINALADANGDPLTADLQGAVINAVSINAVPEPTTALLMGAGLVALLRRKARPAPLRGNAKG